MIHDVSTRYPYSNDLRLDYINHLVDEKRYTEALVEVDRALANFPYSFSLMEKKELFTIVLITLKMLKNSSDNRYLTILVIAHYVRNFMILQNSR